MNVIFALGNFGKQYDLTRHNLGVYFLNNYLKKNGCKFIASKKTLSLLSKIEVGGKDIILCRSQGFMNDSGSFINNFLSYYKVKYQDLTIIYDDIDLELGRLRVKVGGGSAGHQGVCSVMKYDRSNSFCRIRLGIKRGSVGSIKSYVLQKFSYSEIQSLDSFSLHFNDCLTYLINNNPAKTMNLFNSKK